MNCRRLAPDDSDHKFDRHTLIAGDLLTPKNRLIRSELNQKTSATIAPKKNQKMKLARMLIKRSTQIGS